MKKLKFFTLLIFFIFNCSLFTGFGQDWNLLIEKTNALIGEGSYREAMLTADSALKIAIDKEKGSPEQNAITLGKIGIIYYFLGDFDNATEFTVSASNLKRSVFGLSHRTYALSLNNLGSLYQYTGNYSKAESDLITSLEIKKGLGDIDAFTYAKTLHNLARLYQTVGKYELAEKNYLESMKIKSASVGTDDPSYASTLYNYGLLQKQLGNFEGAEKNILKASKVFESKLGSNNQLFLQSILNLSVLYMQLNREDEANQLMSKYSNSIVNSIDENDPSCCQIMYDLAMLNWSKQDFVQAEKYLLKAKPMIEKQLGKTSSLYSSCVNSLGLISWNKNDLDAAYKYLSQSVILKDIFYGENHPDYATALHNLAGLLADMRNYELAEKYYKDALDIYYRQLTNYLPFLSESEKVNFTSLLKDRFDMWTNYVLQRYSIKPSLICDLMKSQMANKSILLNNSIKTRRKILKSGDNTLINMYNAWRSISVQLASCFKMSRPEAQSIGINVDSLEKELYSLEKELSKRSSAFNDVMFSTRFSWIDLKNKLKDDEALVDIVRVNLFDRKWTDSVIYAAIIITSESQGNPVLIILPNSNNFEGSYFSNYSRSISYKLTDDNSYNVYWSKIEERIKGKKRIYLVPDGVYYQLNISSFKKPGGGFVIDDYSVVLLSNSMDLLEEEPLSSKSAEKNAYLFGNPKFNISAYPQLASSEEIQSVNLKIPHFPALTISELPGTKEEIEKLASYLKQNGWNINSFTEENATKNNFNKIEKPGIIHLATHAFFIQKDNRRQYERMLGFDTEKAVLNPLMRSGAYLAGAENALKYPDFDHSKDDGILTSYEVLNMDFDGAYATILSACETGLGELVNGEGVYGLQRSFQIAGSRYVIMSLWKVDDTATKELMLGFYKNWMDGNEIRPAFEKAQKSFKSKYPEPYFWGAFVIVGE